MNKPKIGPRRLAYKNPFIKVSSVQVQFPGFSKTLYVSHYGRRVGVLLFQEDNVLFVRQYRLLLRGFALEIPGGKVDGHETLEAAARRECLEETGLRCLNLKPLLYYHPGLDVNDNPTWMFSCTRSKPVPKQKLDPNEVAELVWIPFPRCLDMVLKGQIVDCLSVAAILAWQVRKMRHDV